MKHSRRSQSLPGHGVITVGLLALLAFWIGSFVLASAQGTVFTDPGRMNQNGNPTTGNCDFRLPGGVTFEWVPPADHIGQPGAQAGLIAPGVETVLPGGAAWRELRAEMDAEIAARQQSNASLQERLAAPKSAVAELPESRVRIASQHTVPPRGP